MSTDYATARATETPVAGRIEGNGAGYPTETHLVSRGGFTDDIVDAERRDIIRWGPILAGVVTALAVMLFLTVLGIALGLSAFTGDQDLASWGTAAGIWGGLSALLAFFFGGWMAGRGSANGPDRNGVLNGFVTGATTLIVLLWLATSALTGALGFFASTVTNLTSAAAPVVTDVATETQAPVAETVQDAATTAGEAIDEALPADPAQAAEDAAESASPGAWGTVIAMVLALGAAILGGMAGQANRVVVSTSRTTIA